MLLKSDDTQWGSLAKFFHWAVVILILIQGTIGLIMTSLPKTPAVIPVYTVHKSLGLTILALALLRLAWRIFDRRPVDPHNVPQWQYVVARSTHVLLYVLLFAVPLSGWLMDSASALRPLYYFGWFKVPSVTGGPMPHVRDVMDTLHPVLFWVLIGVAVVHLAAALQHHFFKNDDVLARMWPWTVPDIKRKMPWTQSDANEEA